MLSHVPDGIRKDAEQYEMTRRGILADMEDLLPDYQREVDELDHELELLCVMIKKDTDAGLNTTRLSDDIRVLRVKLKEAKRELAACERVIEAARKTPSFTQQYIELVSLPGISSTSLESDLLKFVVKAQVEHEGEMYDLGDWGVNIDLTTNVVNVPRIRSGYRKGYAGRLYILANFDFCFGNNARYITDAISTGDFLTGLRLVVLYLNGVNPEDVGKIPDIFEISGG